MKAHQHNSKCGEKFCWHGAFKSKEKAKEKERSTPGAFIRSTLYPPYSIQDRRYAVMTARKNPGRKIPGLLDSNRDYRGHYIKETFHGWSITKNGKHIGWADSIQDAKQKIDSMLGNESRNPLFTRRQKRKLRQQTRQAVRRLFGFKPFKFASGPGAKGKAHRSTERVSPDVKEDAISALINEGYKKSQARKMVAAAAREGDTFDSLFRRLMKRNPNRKSKRNPEATEKEKKALAFYRGFHGHDPKQVISREATIIESGEYAGLGELFGFDLAAFPTASMYRLKPQAESFVDHQTGVRSPNVLTDHLGIKLCGAEIENKDGEWVCHQLIIIEGKQDLEWALKDYFGIDSSTTLVDLGQIKNIWYKARKKQDNYALKHHHHTFAEEERGPGRREAARPYLMYDRKNKKMFVVGGRYTIPVEGIRN